MRHRSRRHGAEILLNTFGSDHQGLKLAALNKTFGFPAVPVMSVRSVRSPKVIVALALALVATILHIGLVT